jgi:uncharacterized protein (AIM24 family)
MAEDEEKKKKKKKKTKASKDETSDKPKTDKKKKKKAKENSDAAVSTSKKPSSKKKESKARTIETQSKAHLVSHASGWDQLELKKSPDAKFAITGNESQVITVALGPNDTCKGEPGSMMYLSPGVTQRATCDGCCERCLSGEDCFVLNFTNSGGSEIGYAAMTPNEPLGKVIPVDLSSNDVGGVLLVQQGTYMASYGDVNIGISLDCNFMRCCCGGAGLVRQKIQGSGTVFLGATGTIVQKVLKPGEVMIMDTNCILAFSESCQLDIKRAGGVVGMIGGGEGIFNTTLTGPGLAIVQSMNKQLFLDALAANKMYRR